MTDRGAKGGYNSAVCPTCNKLFTWTVIHKPEHVLRCTNDIMDPNRKTSTRCPHKMPRHDWEYIGQRQRKEMATYD